MNQQLFAMDLIHYAIQMLKKKAKI